MIFAETSMIIMNKVIGIIGGILGLIGAIFQFFDQTMGWWQDYTTTPLGGITNGTWFLNLLGQITSDNSKFKSETLANTTIVYIVLLAVVIGGILLFIGGITGKSSYGAIGTLLLLGGLIYFVYSLPNIPEIQSLLQNYTVSNYFYSSGQFSILSIVFSNATWRLGNGFFITAGGALLGIISIALKSK